MSSVGLRDSHWTEDVTALHGSTICVLARKLRLKWPAGLLAGDLLGSRGIRNECNKCHLLRFFHSVFLVGRRVGVLAADRANTDAGRGARREAGDSEAA